MLKAMIGPNIPPVKQNETSKKKKKKKREREGENMKKKKKNEVVERSTNE